MGINLAPEGHGDEPDVVVDINTTPLIDVMLVLLIMLIITIPVQTHAVKLDMPNGPPPVDVKKPEIVQVGVDFDGTILWNGKSISSPSELDDRFRSVAALADPPEIHVRPDRLAAYKHVSQVLSSAQRNGVTRIGIVGHEQFVN